MWQVLCAVRFTFYEIRLHALGRRDIYIYCCLIRLQQFTLYGTCTYICYGFPLFETTICLLVGLFIKLEISGWIGVNKLLLICIKSSTMMLNGVIFLWCLGKNTCIIRFYFCALVLLVEYAIRSI